MRMATAAIVAALLSVPAWAGRVCTISERVSDARMQMASAASAAAVGEENGELVGSADQGLGFTIRWADAGVASPTNAAILIANERNSEVVELAGFDAASDGITLPPLLLAELEQRNLGPNTSFRCTIVEPGENGADEIKSSCLVASAAASVKLPNFNYKDENGDVVSTDVGNRTLVAYAKVKPHFIMRDPSNVAQQAQAEKLAEKHAYHVYTYVLPNGLEVTCWDNPLKEQEAYRVSGNLPIDYQLSGATAEMKAATEYALGRWGSILKGPVPVTIQITFRSLVDAYGPDYANVLGSTAVYNAYNFTGDTVCYPSALINQFVGEDVDPNGADVVMQMNTDFPFYYGTDGQCPNSKWDYASILMHEFAHGLGFADAIDPETGSFYWGDDMPGIYDTFLYAGGKRLTALTKANRKAALTGNALYFDGPNAKAANGGSRVKIYAPSVYENGSSVSHWDDSVSFTTFMKAAYRYPLHTPDTRLVGALKDMGYEIAPTIPVPQNVSATKGTYSDRVEVSWNAVSGATSYKVYRATSASGEKTSLGSVASSPYPDYSAVAGTHYYYFVTAVNSDGESAYSAAAEGWKPSGTSLASISISGLASVASGQRATYSCTAYYSNGSSTPNVSPVEWEIVEGSNYATMNGSTLTAGNVTATKTVRLEASYGGKSTTKAITITPPDPDGIRVTFNFNNGSGNTFSKDYPKGSTYGSFPEVSYPGHSLIGWFTALNGGTQVTTSTTVSSTYTTLYAHWSPSDGPLPSGWSYLNGLSDGVSYSGGMLTIVGAGDNTERGIVFTTTGSGTLSLMQKVSSEAGWDFAKILLDGAEVCRMSGTAGGWQSFSKAVGNGTHTWILEYSKDGSRTAGDDTAWFKDISFIGGDEGVLVMFDADGGSASYREKMYTPDEPYGELPTVSRNGYKFLGWYTQRGAGGTKITTSSIVDSSVTTLYAQWNGNGSASWSNDKKTKKSTATAKPKSGYVFAYWVKTSDGSVASYASKLTVATSAKSGYRAVFVRKADVAAPTLDVDSPFVKGGAELDNGRVGVKVNDRFDVPNECRPVKFSAKGLPKGLSVNATSGAIAGVPTKAGKYTVTVTVTSGANSKKKITRKIPVVIYSLPSYVVGSFIGGADDEAAGNRTTLSIASSGKISGKIYYANAVWTVTAANFTDEDGGTYKATLSLKKGKTTQKKTLWIEEDELGGFAYEDNGLFEARQNRWTKDALWKEWAAALNGNSLTTEDGGTTVKFGKNGTVTVTTAFGSYKCSASSVLMPTVLNYEDLDGIIYLYFAPNTKKKFKGRVLALYLE